MNISFFRKNISNFRLNCIFFIILYFLISISGLIGYTINNQGSFSLITISLFLILTLYTFTIFFFNKKKFFYYLLFFAIITAGFYILNYPIFDEIIFILASFVIIINFFYKKKIKFNLIFENYFFLILVFVAFLYSVAGLNYNIKSIRYVALYFSIFIIFLYTISNSFPKINKTLLIDCIYYSSIGYLIIEIILWIIKFYFFKDFFKIEAFLGWMQPANANSATPYTNIVGISGTFISLYILRFNKDYLRPFVFIFILFLVMCLQDSRTIEFLLLFSFIFLLLSKFNFTKLKFLISTIFFCSLLHIFLYTPSEISNTLKNFFPKQLQNIEPLEMGEKSFTYKGKSIIVPKDSDGLRKLYILSSLNYIKNENIKTTFLGCGTYSYWTCNNYLAKLAKEYGLNNLSIPTDKNNINIRPPSLAAIITDFGLLFIFMSFFLIIYCYCSQLKSKFILFKNFEISIFYFYNPTIIIIWTLFGYIEDVSYFYLLAMPNLIFYNLFKKTYF